MDDILIAAEGLTRDYGDRRAVAGVSLTLRRGEALGFLGPNGAGKSTTMQILAGCLAPNAGAVRIAGIDLLENPIAAKARVGYLPEHPPLYPELTVDEYLGYCARLHRLPRRAVAAAVNTTKARCGLADSGRRLIGHLSKGYQQRVGIAQAIVHNPAVVILDEPTVGLDPIQIREIRGLIRELKSNHGIILSTHILPEVQAVCDRVAIIHQGRIALNAALAELATAGAWRIALRRPPALTALAGLPAVTRVEELGNGRYRLDADANDIDAVARAIANNDWGLTELVRETQTVEDLFVRLTCGEAAP
jgi:ABC-2 type transport system ATP-binding protein